MIAPRLVLEQLFSAAVRGADPYAATFAAIDGRTLGARLWILASGKGAVPMARASLDAVAASHRTVLGGVVVTTDNVPAVGPLPVFTGDHPVPGAGSLIASQALSRVVRLVQPGDEVVVLLSGGSTSLMAAPIEGVSADAMCALFRGLHRSGAPIDEMNAMRKRVLRWGAGRLAVALAGSRVTCLIASDVLGDDPAAIASGPCAGDAWTAAGLIELAQRRRLWPHIPDEVRRCLDRTLMGDVPETPKPGAAAFALVEQRIILGNRDALAAIAREGATLGVSIRLAPAPVAGRARSTGASIAHAAVAAREAAAQRALTTPCGLALVWGGETTVPLGAGTTGVGGRAQELALAAAQVLHEYGARGRGITILAAGTDGRDGPTDAAGAIVDGASWSRIALAGRDPVHDLDSHSAYPAHRAAGTLLRTGPTGTNVNDVVIALVD